MLTGFCSRVFAPFAATERWIPNTGVLVELKQLFVTRRAPTSVHLYFRLRRIAPVTSFHCGASPQSEFYFKWAPADGLQDGRPTCFDYVTQVQRSLASLHNCVLSLSWNNATFSSR